MSRRTAATARATTLSTSHHRLLLAFAAALALIAAIPSLAHAAPLPAKAAPAKSIIARHAYAQATPTEFSSAARRHYHQRYVVRGSVRNAYGAYVGGPVYASPSYSYGGYGYGYGDNSRNQTW
ncbi:MAG: hypothetical protein AB1586_02820 [Pseudomonadota bacterium]